MNREQEERVLARAEEVAALLNDPKEIADRGRWLALSKEYGRLKPLSDLLERKRKLTAEREEARALLGDREMAAEAGRELARLQESLQEIEGEISAALPAAETDEEDAVLLEIRAGTGGEEAALFASMLVRMYLRYAERKEWQAELLSLSGTELGGTKEAVISVRGAKAYLWLRSESGVHRIQRVPVTESNGKRQTSTATVVVLKEVEETAFSLRENDLRIDVFRASGHGGQYINKTDSAVRITHLPTGITATCQDEKSQLRNKQKALSVLRARVFDAVNRERIQQEEKNRKTQIGTGDRSERIRTYSFNDGRVTDHRIGKSVYQIDAFTDGDLDPILEPLRRWFEAERLREESEAGGEGENGNRI